MVTWTVVEFITIIVITVSARVQRAVQCPLRHSQSSRFALCSLVGLRFPRELAVE